MPLSWTRHSISHNLVVVTRQGLYSISKGGDRHKQFILRFLPLQQGGIAQVLGIHKHEVDAQDEAERHHQETHHEVPHHDQ